jgi:hypothetical protein
MIVNLQPEGWEIIYHRAHALLAAQIAGHWDFKQDTSRLYETIAAISHHDDLEKEWEEDSLTEVGAPLDFTMERETSVEQLRRHVDDALYKGRWVALLISVHLCFLNQGKRETDTAIADFLDEQRQLQQQWREDLGISKDEMAAAYDLMRWCDRLSLILCQRQIPMGERRLEIITDSNDQRYHIYLTPSGNLTIQPWPFAAERCNFSVEACYLSQLQFESNEELKLKLRQAPRKICSWNFLSSNSAANV